MNARVSYRPWRANYLLAILAAGLAVLCLYLIAIEVIGWHAGGLFALIFAVLARSQLKRGRAREFGKRFETRVIDLAIKALTEQGMKVSANCLLRNGGDADMVVTHRGRRAAVEIKSFVYWHTFFWFWNGDRESAAVRQARRQADELGAQKAIVWLPQGRRTWLQRQLWSRYPNVGKGVHLVTGGRGMLVQAMQELL